MTPSSAVGLAKSESLSQLDQPECESSATDPAPGPAAHAGPGGRAVTVESESQALSVSSTRAVTPVARASSDRFGRGSRSYQAQVDRDGQFPARGYVLRHAGRALRCGPGGALPSGHARRYSSCHWRGQP